MDGIDAQATGPRQEAFGYVCRRCLKCCHHKHIQLNPYEVARLARNRNVTTSEFRAAWTQNGEGLTLGQTETGACVFLGAEGCTVYPDRPLVCRLYPLGRQVLDDRSESFSHLELHPQSRGEFTSTGTIADFLEAQHASPFMQAADGYLLWLSRAQAHLGAADADAADTSEEATEMAHALLDVDAAIARHCTAYGQLNRRSSQDRPPLQLGREIHKRRRQKIGVVLDEKPSKRGLVLEEKHGTKGKSKRHRGRRTTK